MKTIFATMWLLAALGAQGANWYVRPVAQGAVNGTDWNNAWSITGVNAATLSAGDTVWLAGGTYTTGFHLTANGSAGNHILFKRVMATDSVPASAAGWSAGFDSQVIIHPANAAATDFRIPYNGTYITFDGRTGSGRTNNYGIKFITDDWGGNENEGCVSFNGSGAGNITYTNIEMAGPGGLYFFVNNLAVVAIGYGGANNIKVSHCSIHGAVQMAFVRGGASDCIFENNVFWDNHSGNAAHHPNMFDCHTANNLTFRYNDVSDWEVEGFQMWGNCGTFWIYGNIFHDPISYGQYNVATVIWPSSTSCSQGFQGPVYFYNNTFVGNPSWGNLDVTSGQGPGQTLPFGAGSQVRNNIYWLAGWYSGSHPSDMDYEFSGGTAAGAHSVSGGSNPFVDYAGKDFHIVTNISGAYPRDKGVSLSSTYNTDFAGNLRGGDGSWDVGAYENGGTNSGGGGGGSSSPVTWLSPGSYVSGYVVTNGSESVTFTVQNSGSNTLTGMAAVGGAPFSITSGASYAVSNQSASITVRFAPTAAGAFTNTLTLTDNGGGATATLVGFSYPNLASPMALQLGLVVSPFTASGGNLFQTVDTFANPQGGGLAVYGYNAPVAGNYVLSASVEATNSADNSFYINLDAEPNGESMAWDITNIVAGVQSTVVSWRGAEGAFNLPQFSPKIWTLSAGQHYWVVRGREANCVLHSLTVSQPPPSGVQVHRAPAGKAGKLILR